MSKLKDLVGLQFTRLTVIDFDGVRGKHSFWKCECECGSVLVVSSCNLVRGNTKSCGCLQIERTKKALTTHGRSDATIYNMWRTMVNRCYNKTQDSYSNYGGRGMAVCKRWLKFENFLDDMGDRPFLNAQIDRIDNNKGYQPDNCRWVTPKENARNKLNTIMLFWEGKETPLIELGEKYGVHYKCLYKRIRSGWTIEKALLTPPRSNRAKMG